MQARIIASITFEQFNVSLPYDVVVLLALGASEPVPFRRANELIEGVAPLGSHHECDAALVQTTADGADEVFADLIEEQAVGN